MGIVLAGGKSIRFGEDKALAQVRGETFIHRAISLLKELKLEVVIVTSQNKVYSDISCSVIEDLLPDHGSDRKLTAPQGNPSGME